MEFSFRNVLEYIPAATIVIAEDETIIFTNEALSQLTDLAAVEIIGRHISEFFDIKDFPCIAKQALSTGQVLTRAQWRKPNSVDHLPVSLSLRALSSCSEKRHLLLTVEDLRERERIADDLLIAQEAAQIGSWHTSLDGWFFLSPQAAHIFGVPNNRAIHFDELLAKTLPEDREEAMARWQKGLVAGSYECEVKISHMGEIRWVVKRASFEYDREGRPVRGHGTIQDISGHKHAEAEMQRLANFDALTGIPNRRFGIEMGQKIIEGSDQGGQAAAILFVDLNRFKEVNDVHGHAAGDLILIEIAQNCIRVVGDDGVIARLGGDEFMVVLRCETVDDVESIVHRLQEAIAVPVSINRMQIQLSASIGVAICPAHGDCMDELLQCADIAMYQAKSLKVSCQTYDIKMGQNRMRQILLGTRLEYAIKSGLLQLQFQPKIDMHTRQLCGVEALSRWSDREFGWVSPREFIDIAERRGLISELGEWCLRETARQWRKWLDAGITPPTSIAVNISPVQLMDDTFPERAVDLLGAYSMPTSVIDFEITESALLQNPGKSQKVVSRLAALGFTLSIDDFGTGYSSLSRLHQLPVSRLKIDMSFVRDMLSEEGSLAIVATIINMAQSLNLRTVAEGVETIEQHDKLLMLGCDEAQGFLYAKPLSSRDLEKLWLAGSALAPSIGVLKQGE